MRIFKRKYRTKKGSARTTKKFYIEIKDTSGIMRQIPAFTDERQSRELGQKIEKLVVYSLNDEPPDRALTGWIKAMSTPLRQRLVQLGLLDYKRQAMGKPLADHVKDFLQSCRARNVSEGTIRQYGSNLTKILKACKFVRWPDISGSKIEGFLADSRMPPKDWTIKTSNMYLKEIKQFCVWMVKDGRASESPIAHLRGLLILPQDIRRKRRTLEIEEVRRLLRTVENAPPRMGMTGHERMLFYRIMLETGLRRKEVRSLVRSSFDFENLTVAVSPEDTKNKKEATLPIRPELAALFERHVSNKMPDAKVFKTPHKTAEMLKIDLADAGIPYVDDAGQYCDIHALRHTFCSLLAATGTHPKVAQLLMRHSDINLTMSTYCHTLTGQEKQAIHQLPDFSQVDEKKLPGDAGA